MSNMLKTIMRLLVTFSFGLEGVVVAIGALGLLTSAISSFHGLKAIDLVEFAIFSVCSAILIYLSLSFYRDKIKYSQKTLVISCISFVLSLLLSFFIGAGHLFFVEWLNELGVPSLLQSTPLLMCYLSMLLIVARSLLTVLNKSQTETTANESSTASWLRSALILIFSVNFVFGCFFIYNEILKPGHFLDEPIMAAFAMFPVAYFCFAVFKIFKEKLTYGWMTLACSILSAWILFIYYSRAESVAVMTVYAFGMTALTFMAGKSLFTIMKGKRLASAADRKA